MEELPDNFCHDTFIMLKFAIQDSFQAEDYYLKDLFHRKFSVKNFENTPFEVIFVD